MSEKIPENVRLLNTEEQKKFLPSIIRRTQLNLLINSVVSSTLIALSGKTLLEIHNIKTEQVIDREAIGLLITNLLSMFILLGNVEFVLNTIFNASLLRRLYVHKKILEQGGILSHESVADLDEEHGGL